MKFLLFATALPCLVAGPVLSQSNSDPPSDYLAPRKIVFETGPEVHSVVVFDTIPRVDPNEVLEELGRVEALADTFDHEVFM